MDHEEERSVSIGTELSASVPPPSPLTGCYLLAVIGEPHTQDHKEIILQRLIKGLQSWDSGEHQVDLEKELATLTAQAPEGEEARYGERLIQFASENLVTEILIHPQMNTLMQCMRNLLSSFTRHRHLIHAGYTFAGNGSWIMQDGTFSLADFTDAFQENEVQRVIRAYENSISIDVHCSTSGGGDWSKLPNMPFVKHCRIRVNPTDILDSGSQAIKDFIGYVTPYVEPASLDQLLVSSDVVGNIRFSHPTLYVFPGGQGDAALFGINGFNMLVDGGFSRKACWWDFARHLDRLDAVLFTRLNNCSVSGMAAVLRRKASANVYPQIGHFFCNLEERRAIASPDGDKDFDPLLVSLLQEGSDMMADLRHINLKPQHCYRGPEPINLYHKVGHGTLDMYVLNPSKDSKYVRDFLKRWHNSEQKLFENATGSGQFNFPVPNLVSICALLVWRPANPDDTITRIMFPGSTPQHKIFEGLEKLKHLEFLNHPTCTGRQIAAANATSATTATTRTKQSTKVISKERSILMDKKDDKITEPEPPQKISTTKDDIDSKNIIDNKLLSELADDEEKNIETVLQEAVLNRVQTKLNGTIPQDERKDTVIKKSKKEKPSMDKKSKRVDKTEDTKDIHIITNTIESKKSDIDTKIKTEINKRTESRKTESTVSRTKISHRTQRIDKKSVISDKKLVSEDKTSPPVTLKKVIENKTITKETVVQPTTKSRVKSRKVSPVSTTAKSTKEANNKRVMESKYKQISPKREPQKVSDKKDGKPKREPISRRPRPLASPIKAMKVMKSPSKLLKSDKIKIETSKLKGLQRVNYEDILREAKKSDEDTSKSFDDMKQQELDEREEQEIVREIEAVFNRDSEADEKIEYVGRSDIEKITCMIGNRKTEGAVDGEFEEEYLIIEKEEIDQITEDSLIDKVLEQGDESQKHLRDKVESEKKSFVIAVKSSAIIEEDTKDIKNVESKEHSDSLEEKHDISSEKKTSDSKSGIAKPKDSLDLNIVLESQPDEKASTTVESGATTAPTLPEDERIPLDEIREDHRLEEKQIKEEIREIILPQSLPDTQKSRSSKSPKVEPQAVPIRDIVKTPDEVADLPLHEEVDYRSFEEIKKSSAEEDMFKRKPDFGFVHEIKVPKDLPLREQDTKVLFQKDKTIEDDVVVKTVQRASHAELVTVTPGSAPESPLYAEPPKDTSLKKELEPVKEFVDNEYDYGQFTEKLRETHITTVDSPIKEEILHVTEVSGLPEKIPSIPEDVEKELEESIKCEDLSKSPRILKDVEKIVADVAQVLKSEKTLDEIMRSKSPIPSEKIMEVHEVKVEDIKQKAKHESEILEKIQKEISPARSLTSEDVSESSDKTVLSDVKHLSKQDQKVVLVTQTKEEEIKEALATQKDVTTKTMLEEKGVDVIIENVDDLMKDTATEKQGVTSDKAQVILSKTQIQEKTPDVLKIERKDEALVLDNGISPIEDNKGIETEFTKDIEHKFVKTGQRSMPKGSISEKDIQTKNEEMVVKKYYGEEFVQDKPPISISSGIETITDISSDVYTSISLRKDYDKSLGQVLDVENRETREKYLTHENIAKDNFNLVASVKDGETVLEPIDKNETPVQEKENEDTLQAKEAIIKEASSVKESLKVDKSPVKVTVEKKTATIVETSPIREPSSDKETIKMIKKSSPVKEIVEDNNIENSLKEASSAKESIVKEVSSVKDSIEKKDSPVKQAPPELKIIEKERSPEIEASLITETTGDAIFIKEALSDKRVKDEPPASSIEISIIKQVLSVKDTTPVAEKIDKEAQLIKDTLPISETAEKNEQLSLLDKESIKETSPVKQTLSPKETIEKDESPASLIEKTVVKQVSPMKETPPATERVEEEAPLIKDSLSVSEPAEKDKTPISLMKESIEGTSPVKEALSSKETIDEYDPPASPVDKSVVKEVLLVKERSPDTEKVDKETPMIKNSLSVNETDEKVELLSSPVKESIENDEPPASPVKETVVKQASPMKVISPVAGKVKEETQLIKDALSATKIIEKDEPPSSLVKESIEEKPPVKQTLSPKETNIKEEPPALTVEKSIVKKVSPVKDTMPVAEKDNKETELIKDSEVAEKVEPPSSLIKESIEKDELPALSDEKIIVQEVSLVKDTSPVTKKVDMVADSIKDSSVSETAEKDEPPLSLVKESITEKSLIKKASWSKEIIDKVEPPASPVEKSIVKQVSPVKDTSLVLEKDENEAVSIKDSSASETAEKVEPPLTLVQESIVKTSPVKKALLSKEAIDKVESPASPVDKSIVKQIPPVKDTSLVPEKDDNEAESIKVSLSISETGEKDEPSSLFVKETIKKDDMPASPDEKSIIKKESPVKDTSPVAEMVDKILEMNKDSLSVSEIAEKVEPLSSPVKKSIETDETASPVEKSFVKQVSPLKDASSDSENVDMEEPLIKDSLSVGETAEKVEALSSPIKESIEKVELPASPIEKSIIKQVSPVKDELSPTEKVDMETPMIKDSVSISGPVEKVEPPSSLVKESNEETSPHKDALSPKEIIVKFEPHTSPVQKSIVNQVSPVKDITPVTEKDDKETGLIKDSESVIEIAEKVEPLSTATKESSKKDEIPAIPDEKSTVEEVSLEKDMSPVAEKIDKEAELIKDLLSISKTAEMFETPSSLVKESIIETSPVIKPLSPKETIDKVEPPASVVEKSIVRQVSPVEDISPVAEKDNKEEELIKDSFSVGEVAQKVEPLSSPVKETIEKDEIPTSPVEKSIPKQVSPLKDASSDTKKVKEEAAFFKDSLSVNETAEKVEPSSSLVKESIEKAELPALSDEKSIVQEVSPTKDSSPVAEKVDMEAPSIKDSLANEPAKKVELPSSLVKESIEKTLPLEKELSPKATIEKNEPPALTVEKSIMKQVSPLKDTSTDTEKVDQEALKIKDSLLVSEAAEKVEPLSSPVKELIEKDELPAMSDEKSIVQEVSPVKDSSPVAEKVGMGAPIKDSLANEPVKKVEPTSSLVKESIEKDELPSLSDEKSIVQKVSPAKDSSPVAEKVDMEAPSIKDSLANEPAKKVELPSSLVKESIEKTLPLEKELSPKATIEKNEPPALTVEKSIMKQVSPLKYTSSDTEKVDQEPLKIKDSLSVSEAAEKVEPLSSPVKESTEKDELHTSPVETSIPKQISLPKDALSDTEKVKLEAVFFKDSMSVSETAEKVEPLSSLVKESIEKDELPALSDEKSIVHEVSPVKDSSSVAEKVDMEALFIKEPFVNKPAKKDEPPSSLAKESIEETLPLQKALSPKATIDKDETLASPVEKSIVKQVSPVKESSSDIEKEQKDALNIKDSLSISEATEKVEPLSSPVKESIEKDEMPTSSDEKSIVKEISLIEDTSRVAENVNKEAPLVKDPSVSEPAEKVEPPSSLVKESIKETSPIKKVLSPKESIGKVKAPASPVEKSIVKQVTPVKEISPVAEKDNKEEELIKGSFSVGEVAQKVEPLSSPVKETIERDEIPTSPIEKSITKQVSLVKDASSVTEVVDMETRLIKDSLVSEPAEKVEPPSSLVKESNEETLPLEKALSPKQTVDKGETLASPVEKSIVKQVTTVKEISPVADKFEKEAELNKDLLSGSEAAENVEHLSSPVKESIEKDEIPTLPDDKSIVMKKSLIEDTSHIAKNVDNEAPLIEDSSVREPAEKVEPPSSLVKESMEETLPLEKALSPKETVDKDETLASSVEKSITKQVSPMKESSSDTEKLDQEALNIKDSLPISEAAERVEPLSSPVKESIEKDEIPTLPDDKSIVMKKSLIEDTSHIAENVDKEEPLIEDPSVREPAEKVEPPSSLVKESIEETLPLEKALSPKETVDKDETLASPVEKSITKQVSPMKESSSDTEKLDQEALNIKDSLPISEAAERVEPLSSPIKDSIEKDELPALPDEKFIETEKSLTEDTSRIAENVDKEAPLIEDPSVREPAEKVEPPSSLVKESIEETLPLEKALSPKETVDKDEPLALPVVKSILKQVSPVKEISPVADKFEKEAELIKDSLSVCETVEKVEPLFSPDKESIGKDQIPTLPDDKSNVKEISLIEDTSRIAENVDKEAPLIKDSLVSEPAEKVEPPSPLVKESIEETLPIKKALSPKETIGKVEAPASPVEKSILKQVSPVKDSSSDTEKLEQEPLNIKDSLSVSKAAEKVEPLTSSVKESVEKEEILISPIEKFITKQVSLVKDTSSVTEEVDMETRLIKDSLVKEPAQKVEPTSSLVKEPIEETLPLEKALSPKETVEKDETPSSVEKSIVKQVSPVKESSSDTEKLDQEALNIKDSLPISEAAERVEPLSSPVKESIEKDEIPTLPDKKFIEKEKSLTEDTSRIAENVDKEEPLIEDPSVREPAEKVEPPSSLVKESIEETLPLEKALSPKETVDKVETLASPVEKSIVKQVTPVKEISPVAEKFEKEAKLNKDLLSGSEAAENVEPLSSPVKESIGKDEISTLPDDKSIVKEKSLIEDTSRIAENVDKEAPLIKDSLVREPAEKVEPPSSLVKKSIEETIPLEKALSPKETVDKDETLASPVEKSIIKQVSLVKESSSDTEKLDQEALNIKDSLPISEAAERVEPLSSPIKDSIEKDELPALPDEKFIEKEKSLTEDTSRIAENVDKEAPLIEDPSVREPAEKVEPPSSLVKESIEETLPLEKALSPEETVDKDEPLALPVVKSIVKQVTPVKEISPVAEKFEKEAKLNKDSLSVSKAAEKVEPLTSSVKESVEKDEILISPIEKSITKQVSLVKDTSSVTEEVDMETRSIKDSLVKEPAQKVEPTSSLVKEPIEETLPLEKALSPKETVDKDETLASPVEKSIIKQVSPVKESSSDTEKLDQEALNIKDSLPISEAAERVEPLSSPIKDSIEKDELPALPDEKFIEKEKSLTEDTSRIAENVDKEAPLIEDPSVREPAEKVEPPSSLVKESIEETLPLEKALSPKETVDKDEPLALPVVKSILKQVSPVKEISPVADKFDKEAELIKDSLSVCEAVEKVEPLSSPIKESIGKYQIPTLPDDKSNVKEISLIEDTSRIAENVDKEAPLIKDSLVREPAEKVEPPSSLVKKSIEETIPLEKALSPKETVDKDETLASPVEKSIIKQVSPVKESSSDTEKLDQEAFNIKDSLPISEAAERVEPLSSPIKDSIEKDELPALPDEKFIEKEKSLTEDTSRIAENVDKEAPLIEDPSVREPAEKVEPPSSLVKESIDETLPLEKALSPKETVDKDEPLALPVVKSILKQVSPVKEISPVADNFDMEAELIRDSLSVCETVGKVESLSSPVKESIEKDEIPSLPDDKFIVKETSPLKDASSDTEKVKEESSLIKDLLTDSETAEKVEDLSSPIKVSIEKDELDTLPDEKSIVKEISLIEDTSRVIENVRNEAPLIKDLSVSKPAEKVEPPSSIIKESNEEEMPKGTFDKDEPPALTVEKSILKQVSPLKEISPVVDKFDKEAELIKDSLSVYETVEKVEPLSSPVKESFGKDEIPTLPDDKSIVKEISLIEDTSRIGENVDKEAPLIKDSSVRELAEKVEPPSPLVKESIEETSPMKNALSPKETIGEIEAPASSVEKSIVKQVSPVKEISSVADKLDKEVEFIKDSLSVCKAVDKVESLSSPVKESIEKDAIPTLPDGKSIVKEISPLKDVSSDTEKVKEESSFIKDSLTVSETADKVEGLSSPVQVSIERDELDTLPDEKFIVKEISLIEDTSRVVENVNKEAPLIKDSLVSESAERVEPPLSLVKESNEETLPLEKALSPKETVDKDETLASPVEKFIVKQVTTVKEISPVADKFEKEAELNKDLLSGSEAAENVEHLSSPVKESIGKDEIPTLPDDKSIVMEKSLIEDTSHIAKNVDKEAPLIEDSSVRELAEKVEPPSPKETSDKDEAPVSPVEKSIVMEISLLKGTSPVPRNVEEEAPLIIDSLSVSKTADKAEPLSPLVKNSVGKTPLPIKESSFVMEIVEKKALPVILLTENETLPVKEIVEKYEPPITFAKDLIEKGIPPDNASLVKETIGDAPSSKEVSSPRATIENDKPLTLPVEKIMDSFSVNESAEMVKSLPSTVKETIENLSLSMSDSTPTEDSLVSEESIKKNKVSIKVIDEKDTIPFKEESVLKDTSPFKETFKKETSSVIENLPTKDEAAFEKELMSKKAPLVQKITDTESCILGTPASVIKGEFDDKNKQITKNDVSNTKYAVTSELYKGISEISSDKIYVEELELAKCLPNGNIKHITTDDDRDQSPPLVEPDDILKTFAQSTVETCISIAPKGTSTAKDSVVRIVAHESSPEDISKEVSLEEKYSLECSEKDLKSITLKELSISDISEIQTSLLDSNTSHNVTKTETVIQKDLIKRKSSGTERDFKEDSALSETSDSGVHSIALDSDQTYEIEHDKKPRSSLKDKDRDFLETISKALTEDENIQQIIKSDIVCSEIERVSTPPTVPVSPLPKTPSSAQDVKIGDIQSAISYEKSDVAEETVTKVVHVGDDVLTQKISTFTEKMPKTSKTDEFDSESDINILMQNVGKLKTETDTVTKVIKEGENVVTQTITTVTTREIISKEDGTPQNIKTTIETTTLSKSSDGSTTTSTDTKTMLSECSSTLKSMSQMDLYSIEPKVTKDNESGDDTHRGTISRADSDNNVRQSTSKDNIYDNGLGSFENQYILISDEQDEIENNIEDTTIDTDVSKKIIKENNVDIVETVTTITKKETLRVNETKKIIKTTVETNITKEKPDGSKDSQKNVEIKTEEVVLDSSSSLENLLQELTSNEPDIHETTDTTVFYKDKISIKRVILTRVEKTKYSDDQGIVKKVKTVTTITTTDYYPDGSSRSKVETNISISDTESEDLPDNYELNDFKLEDRSTSVDTQEKYSYRDNLKVKQLIVITTTKEILISIDGSKKKLKTTTETVTETELPDGVKEIARDVKVSVSDYKPEMNEDLDGYEPIGDIDESTTRETETLTENGILVVRHTTVTTTRQELQSMTGAIRKIKTIVKTVIEDELPDGTLITKTTEKVSIADILPKTPSPSFVERSEIEEQLQHDESEVVEDTVIDTDVKKEEVKQGDILIKRTITTKSKRDTLASSNKNIKRIRTTVETTTLDEYPDGSTETTKDVKITISEFQKSSDNDLQAALEGLNSTGKIRKSVDQQINTFMENGEDIVQTITTHVTKEEFVSNDSNEVAVKTVTETITENKKRDGSVETAKDIRTQITYLPAGTSLEDWSPEQLDEIQSQAIVLDEKPVVESLPLEEVIPQKEVLKPRLKQRSPVGEVTSDTDTYTKVIKEGDNEITQTITVVTTKEVISPEKVKITVETTTVSKGSDGVTKTTKSTKTTISEFKEEYEETIDTGESEKSFSKHSSKTGEFHSSSAASDDLDHHGIASPPSDISSGHGSRAATNVWGTESSGVYYSDDDGAGSPSSTKSQIAHSPRSNLSFELDATKRDDDFKPDSDGPFSQQRDPMSTSIYGQLQEDDSCTSSSHSEVKSVEEKPMSSITKEFLIHEKRNADDMLIRSIKTSDATFLKEADEQFEKAIEEHKKVSGSEVISNITAKYELRSQSDSASTSSTKEESITLKDIKSTSSTKSESKTESTITKSSVQSREVKEKDPIESWGKPLGLPSPLVPPIDGNRTPKKQNTVLNKNKINQEKTKEARNRASESPNKKKTPSPVYLELTYVPHHGNSYYSAMEFFKRVRARYYVFSGTEPSKEIYNALLDAKKTWEDKDLEVTIIPTYDTDVLGYWVTENEEALEKYKIDLSPSASRCTINLQDHETSCAAYRLEF